MQSQSMQRTATEVTSDVLKLRMMHCNILVASGPAVTVGVQRLLLPRSVAQPGVPGVPGSVPEPEAGRARPVV
jgi:hypothetical protein